MSRKFVSDCTGVVSSGRAFQIWGSATENALLSTVESLTGGTSRRLVLAERSDRQPGKSATRARGARYRGADLCRTLYVNTAILYSISSGTRSQWKLASVSVMWFADLMSRHVVDLLCCCIQYRQK